VIGSVTIVVYGKDLHELREQAARQWREFSKDASASLPHDTELRVEEHSEKEYKATVTVRLRIAER
jgi:hypothetical protein